MRSQEYYLVEINNIDNELKRINEHAKNLRAQKAKTMGGLRQYMISNGLEQVSDGKKTISLKKCEPRKKARSKPKKQKRSDAIQLFRDAGIPNPEKFYEEFESVQKIPTGDDQNDLSYSGNTSKPVKGKKKDSGIDPFLGF